MVERSRRALRHEDGKQGLSHEAKAESVNNTSHQCEFIVHKVRHYMYSVCRNHKARDLPYFMLRKNSARKDVATGTNTLVTFPHPSENANEIASSIRLSGTQGGIAKAIGQKGRGRG
jgi:hypothetical protein